MNFITLDDPVAMPGTTSAFGISPSGQLIVGNYQDASGNYQGFLLSGGTYTTLDISSSSTHLSGVNDVGQVVGYYVGTDGLNHGDLYSGGTHELIAPPGSIASMALGINNAGQVVGTYEDSAFHLHGFLFNNGTYTTIDEPIGTDTVATGINKAGYVTGYYYTPGAIHGFLFAGGTFETLDGPPNASNVQAFGINTASEIIGTMFLPNPLATHGFLHELLGGAGYTIIDDPLAFDTSAQGIDDAGDIVGYFQSGGRSHGFLETNSPNLPPPAGTTADMVLTDVNSGTREIYDLGSNAILATYSLGQVGTDWKYAGLGGFFGNDTTDMLLRNSGTGGFEVYDISNNLITNAAFLGAVGLDWDVQGFGNFSGNPGQPPVPGETDMILRSTSITGLGAFAVYDIRNNQITGFNFMGRVGLTWSVQGFGDFNGDGTTDMIMRNALTGVLQVYDIANNQFTSSAPIGTIGREWRASGFGNFSSNPDETDMLMRNFNTGELRVYDISNNQITDSHALGVIGLDWQFAGVAPAHATGASDLVLRNVNGGQFEVYDIAGNSIVGAASLGQIGLDWQLGGFAVDPPSGTMGASDRSNSQLVQAMASFGGGSGAADGVTTTVPGADTSQQTFLTTPQRA